MWALKIKKIYKKKQRGGGSINWFVQSWGPWKSCGLLEFFSLICGWGSGCRATWHYQRGVWLPSMLVMFAFSGCQIWLWKIHKSESSAHVSCHSVLVKSKVTCCQSVRWGTLKQHSGCCKHTRTHSSKTYHTLTQLKGVKWIISAQPKRHSTFL